MNKKHNERQALATSVMFVPTSIYNIHWKGNSMLNPEMFTLLHVRLLLAVPELIVRMCFSIWNVRWSVPAKSQNDVNKMDATAVAVAWPGARESPKY